MLWQGCGRMLGVPSLAPGCSQVPHQGGDASLDSAMQFQWLVGSPPVCTSGQGPQGGYGHIMSRSVLIMGDNSVVPSWPHVHRQDKAVHPTQS